MGWVWALKFSPHGSPATHTNRSLLTLRRSVAVLCSQESTVCQLLLTELHRSLQTSPDSSVLYVVAQTCYFIAKWINNVLNLMIRSRQS